MTKSQSEKVSQPENNRRSTAMVRQPGDGYLPNGKPNLSPTAGYAHVYPVQYADENDVQYAGRVAMWESAYASAQAIEAGGATFEQKKAALTARYDAEMLALEAAEEQSERAASFAREQAGLAPVKAAKGKGK